MLPFVIRPHEIRQNLLEQRSVFPFDDLLPERVIGKQIESEIDYLLKLEKIYPGHGFVQIVKPLRQKKDRSISG